MLDEVTVLWKDLVHSLGVLLGPALLLDKQEVAVTRRVFFQLWLVRQLQPFQEKKDLATITHAQVTSRLAYCVRLPFETSRKFNLMQNAAAGMLGGSNNCEHVTSILHALRWLPAIFCVQFTELNL